MLSKNKNYLLTDPLLMAVCRCHISSTAIVSIDSIRPPQIHRFGIRLYPGMAGTLLTSPQRSPDGAQRNPGFRASNETAPDFAALHPAFSLIQFSLRVDTANAAVGPREWRSIVNRKSLSPMMRIE